MYNLFVCSPSEPVNFSRLLSMDYQKEWIKNNEERLRDKDKHEQVSVFKLDISFLLLAGKERSTETKIIGTHQKS